jgi:putative ABC transport system permease protein
VSRLVRLLLAAYPRSFRRTYGADFELLFVERHDEARAAGKGGRFLIRSALNIIATAAAERFERRRVTRARRLQQERKAIMSGLAHDLTYAFRLLRRQPGFALFVVLTLAIGIGANTAVFSVVDGVLLRPLPYPDSDRLVNVWGRFDPESGFDFPQFSLSAPEYLDYRQQTRALEDVAAAREQSVTVGGAEPERVMAVAVTGNLFSVLRAAPILGRTFSPDEMKPGGARVVVLSYGYWQTRFGGQAAILGSPVSINNEPATVIGVMPRTFAYPAPEVQLWTPLRIDPANPGSRSGHSYGAIGRLAPGVELEAARAELQSLMNNWKAQYPTVHTGHYLFIRPMLEDVAGDIRPALLLLLASTGFVLLIVCANVASVVMARGEARTREMAIRGALGAGRSRLIRLTLIESGVLGVSGGMLGLVLAYAAVRGLLAIDPASVPRSGELGIDLRVVLFAGGASLASAVLFGVLPAIRGAGGQLQGTLREASRATTAGAGRQLLRRGLVAAEVALSVLLVVGAGLMLRSFSKLLSVETGFRPDGVVTASVSLPAATYKDAASVEAFYKTVIERVRSAPTIRSVSAGNVVPLMSDQGVWDFEVEGREPPRPGQVAWNAVAVIVRPGYFETLGIPLARGRLFTEHDDERAMPVVVINQAMASKFFAGDDPIGHRIRVTGNTTPESWMTVVGIAGDVRAESLDTAPAPAYHFLQSQVPRTNGGPARTMSILARTDGAPEHAIAAIRSSVSDLDPGLALYDVETSASVVQRSVSRPRFTTQLLGLFALIGIVLGASGIYGVLAYTVARRTQEIGIRRALGAQPRQVVSEVLATGMAPVAVGLAMGLVASYWTSRAWSAQLFEISPADPIVYVAVIVGVLLVALAAMVVPVRRAMKVSPLLALRAE